MASRLPEGERLLIWKLSEAHNHAADLGLTSVAHIIRLALDEIRDIADRHVVSDQKSPEGQSDVGCT
ncbi:MAG: hypothetical protein ACTHLY_08155 [Pseudolabrys sp.]